MNKTPQPHHFQQQFEKKPHNNVQLAEKQENCGPPGRKFERRSLIMTESFTDVIRMNCYQEILNQKTSSSTDSPQLYDIIRLHFEKQ